MEVDNKCEETQLNKAMYGIASVLLLKARRYFCCIISEDLG